MIAATQPSPDRRPRRWALTLILLLAALGFALVAYAYWPGVMIDDARWQYQQAVDNAYEDWHPPLMAWLWRRLMFIHPGPAPMLLLQLALYWGGIVLIAGWAYRRGRPRLGAALALVGWLPVPLALTGTVVKDCLMSGLLGCAAGLALWRCQVRTSAARAAVSVIAMIALLLAAALRFNAFLACVPLALAALPRSFLFPRWRLAATIFAATVAFVAAGPLVARLVGAEKSDVSLSLIIFDLGGITEHSRVSAFPDMQVRDPVAVNHRCYDPYEWDSYSNWAKTPCPLGFDRFEALVDDDDLDPIATWVRAILSHPWAYAEHRLAHFNLSTWFLVRQSPQHPAWSQSVPNPWGYQVRDNRALRTMTAVSDASGSTPLGWPVFWISIALAATIAGVGARLRLEIVAIACSAWLYGLGYLVVGVATGMRYYLWTISGAAVAAVLVTGELWQRRDAIDPRLRGVCGAVVIVPTALAIAARLGS